MESPPLPRSRLVFGWLALLALNALFWIPCAALPGDPLAAIAQPRSLRGVFSFLWLSQDVVVAAALLHFFPRRRLRITLGVLLSALFVYEVYDVAILVAFRRAPVLYDDTLLVGRAGHLVADLSSTAGLAILGGVLGLLVVVRAIPWLLDVARRALEVPATANRVALAACALLVGAAHLDRSAAERDNLVQSPANRLTRNLHMSAAMAEALVRVEEGAPARPVADRLELGDPPNIYLLMVEAYGSILLDDPETRSKYLELLSHLEARLEAAGWSSASARSDAPVVGGTSWLSIASVLGGLRIDSQHLFHRFISQHTAGALPSLLHNSGYFTVALEPGTRNRPGLPLGNPYGYQKLISGDDLDYRGPTYGWGVIPDQYSLGFAATELLNSLPSPHFVFFMSVSTHVPWNQIPPIREDWRTLRDEGDAGQASFAARLRDRLRARVQGMPVLALDEYLAAVAYDLEVLTDFIVERVPRNSVVVLMGDHQPMVLDPRATDRSTPVHIISDDRAIFAGLESLEAQGELGADRTPPQAGSIFRPGLVASRNTKHLKHEGIQSLLLRLLAETRGGGGTTPEYLPSGAPLSLLRHEP